MLGRDMTKYELSRLCKRYRWKRYSHLRKADLLGYISRRLHAIRLIQRWWKRHNQPVNKEDVFTLEPHTQHKRFIFQEGHQRYQFDCKTLLEYMFSTGKFENPYTRTRLSERTLNHLQRTFFHHYPYDTSLRYNNNRLSLSRSSNMVDVARSVTFERREEHENNSTVSFLLQESAVHLNSFLDQIQGQTFEEAASLIHAYLIPNLTNTAISVLSLNQRRGESWISSLRSVFEDLNRVMMHDLFSAVIESLDDIMQLD